MMKEKGDRLDSASSLGVVSGRNGKSILAHCSRTQVRGLPSVSRALFSTRSTKHAMAFLTAILSVFPLRSSSMALATKFGRGSGSFTASTLRGRQVVEAMVLTILEEGLERPGKCGGIGTLFDHLLDNFTKHLMLSFIKRNKRQHPW